MVIEANTVIVTFDDGYESNYRENFPILRELQIPATGFLTPGLIGTDQLFWWDQVTFALNHTRKKRLVLDGGDWALGTQIHKDKAAGSLLLRLKKLPEREKQQMVERVMSCLEVNPERLGQSKRLMDWAQVRQMNAAGIDFGAHTVSHAILTRIPAHEARREIEDSKAIIEQQLGRAVEFFCYPNGEQSDFDEEIKNLVRQAGFRCALTTVPGTAGLDCDLFALKRMPMAEDVTLPVLAVTVCGLAGKGRWLN